MLYPCVYVLQLQHGKYYVGLGTAGCGVEQRWAKHIAGIGSQFCKDHHPTGLIDVYYPADKSVEDAVTVYYATMHGAENVRGGKWCKVSPPTQPSHKRTRED